MTADVFQIQLQRAVGLPAENNPGPFRRSADLDALLFAEPDARMISQGAEKEADFAPGNGVDPGGGSGELFERGEDAFIVLAYRETVAEAAQRGIKRL